MSEAVLITGPSSGFGKDASLLVKSKGWNVSARMRTRAPVYASHIDCEIEEPGVSV
jgi:NADP-dependent 3-hydroxy acid dehydrogenase YdfG